MLRTHRIRCALLTLLLLSGAARAEAPDGTAPPADQTGAPVYLIPERDAQRAVVAQTRAEEQVREAERARVQDVLGAMRHMGWVSLSALAMLLGSALLGVALALGRQGFKRRRGG